MKLSDIAQVIRSKNAGPRRLTFDVIFASDADYRRVVQSPALGYARWRAATLEVLSDLSNAERDAVLGGTALAFYGL